MKTPFKAWRVYDPGAINEEIQKKESFLALPNHKTMSPLVDLSLVVGKVTSIEIQEDGSLMCKWERLDTPMSKIVDAFLDNATISPVGTGFVDDNGVVTEYNLCYFIIQRAE